MPTEPTPSLKRTYRITKIEAVDVAGQPGQPSVVQVKVTGSQLPEPGDPPQPIADQKTWDFDPTAAQFFNVDENVVAETIFSRPPAA